MINLVLKWLLSYTRKCSGETCRMSRCVVVFMLLRKRKETNGLTILMQPIRPVIRCGIVKMRYTVRRMMEKGISSLSRKTMIKVFKVWGMVHYIGFLMCILVHDSHLSTSDVSEAPTTRGVIFVKKQTVLFDFISLTSACKS